jgi:hypothetical protein
MNEEGTEAAADMPAPEDFVADGRPPVHVFDLGELHGRGGVRRASDRTFAFALNFDLETEALFVRLISHQPAVLFSQNKPATTNQPAVFFSQNKPAPAISHQPNEQAQTWCLLLQYVVGCSKLLRCLCENGSIKLEVGSCWIVNQVNLVIFNV